MEGIERLQQSLQKKYGGKVTVEYKDQSIVVSGHLDKWEDIVAACQMCVQSDKKLHVVNDIVLDGVEVPKMRVPSLKDDALEGDRPDVLIIGGGISGASIARELSKWKLNILLVEKESDLAMP